MRTIRRLLPLLLVLLGLAFLKPDVAGACSCAGASPEESAAQADLVFLGTVAEVTLTNRSVRAGSSDPLRVVFDVQTVYKGDGEEELVLETARDGASCGYTFQVGQRYLVYARAVDGVLTTDLCSGTKTEFDATADLTFLGGGTVVGRLSDPGFPLWIGILLASGVVALLLAWLFTAINQRLARRRTSYTPY